MFAPAIGPTFGGWITDNFSWRWVFLHQRAGRRHPDVLAMRILADPPREIAARRARAGNTAGLDYPGFALLVIGMCALQVVLDKGQENDWFASSLITDLSMTAALALPAFVIWELRRADPIVDLRLFANRSFAVGNLLMFMLGFVLLGSDRAAAALRAAAARLHRDRCRARPLARRVCPDADDAGDRRALRQARRALADRGGARRHRAGDAPHDRVLCRHRLLRPLPGRGSISRSASVFLFIPINTAAYIGVPSEKNNNASAIINMMRNIGGSVGIAALTTSIARRQQYHQSVLVEHVTASSASARHVLNGFERLTMPHHASAIDALHQA